MMATVHNSRCKFSPWLATRIDGENRDVSFLEEKQV